MGSADGDTVEPQARRIRPPLAARAAGGRWPRRSRRTRRRCWRRRRTSPPANRRKLAIDAIAAAMPMEFLAGSADLTGSNNNKAKSAVDFSAKTPKGRFIHYGIREHGMAAAMNGIFLHGGFAPNGAHLPGVHRLCPPGDAAGRADGDRRGLCHDPRFRSGSAKTARPISRSNISRRCAPFRICACSAPAMRSRSPECWELALNRIDGPTVLVLTRQNLPQLRTTAPPDNPCRHGGYELVAAQGEAKVSLFASGSEVEIAVDAQKQLAERGIASRVVSVPSLELLLAQPAEPAAGDHRQRAGQGGDRGRGALGLGRRDRARTANSSACTDFGASAPGQGPFQAFRNYRRGRGQRCPEATSADG